MLMLADLACALTVAVIPQTPDRADLALPRYPVAALAAAVDLPTRALRETAAVQLARRSVPLKQWHEAAGKLRLRTSMGARVDAQTLKYELKIHVMHADRAAEVLVRTPSGELAPGPQPVLFCWHGAGGDGASAMRVWATLADRYGLLLVAPTESYEPYRKEGWSFHPDGYEGVQEVLRFVRRHYDVDENRIVLAGVRGGGHMAWDCGLRFADQFAAILPANGSPRLGNPNRDSNMMFLESIAHVPVRSLHWGLQEDAQTENVQRSLAVLRRFGSTTAVRLEYDSQLHALNPNGVGWSEFFATRRTVPAKLVKFPDRAWVPHRREFGRHHWLEVLAYDRTARLPFPPKVVASKWRKLDEEGRLAYVDQYLRDTMPRIEIDAATPGRFDVTARHIESFRLLLTRELIGQVDTVEVRWRGRRHKLPVVPSAEVFLREFVERFDRTFLPIAEVVLKK